MENFDPAKYVQHDKKNQTQIILRVFLLQYKTFPYELIVLFIPRKWNTGLAIR